jgi:hypothetical protein
VDGILHFPVWTNSPEGIAQLRVIEDRSLFHSGWIVVPPAVSKGLLD